MFPFPCLGCRPPTQALALLALPTPSDLGHPSPQIFHLTPPEKQHWSISKRHSCPGPEVALPTKTIHLQDADVQQRTYLSWIYHFFPIDFRNHDASSRFNPCAGFGVILQRQIACYP